MRFALRVNAARNPKLMPPFSLARLSEGADQLPATVAALQALVVAARAQRDVAIAERD